MSGLPWRGSLGAPYPGRIWLQSLPLSRMADRIYAAAPQVKRGRKEEGSILDHAFGLGDLIDGR